MCDGPSQHGCDRPVRQRLELKSAAVCIGCVTARLGHGRRNSDTLLQREGYGRALGNIRQPRPLLFVQLAVKTQDTGDRAFLAFHSKRTSTRTPRSGHALRAAYMRSVIAVQAPNAEHNSSYGAGPTSLPPRFTLSSAMS